MTENWELALRTEYSCCHHDQACRIMSREARAPSHPSSAISMTTIRAALALFATIATIGCGASSELKTESAALAASVVADTMGPAPASVRTIALQARPELVENSGVTSS